MTHTADSVRDFFLSNAQPGIAMGIGNAVMREADSVILAAAGAFPPSDMIVARILAAYAFAAAAADQIANEYDVPLPVAMAAVRAIRDNLPAEYDGDVHRI